VADQVISVVVEDLRKSKGAVQSAVLVHLVNDPTDYVSDQIRDTIEQSGTFDLRDRMLDEKVKKALKLRIDSVSDLNSALARSQGLGAQGVLFGKINAFESYPNGAKIDLEITLADIVSRDVVFNRRYNKEIGSGLLNPAVVKDSVHELGGVQRFLGWLVLVLLLPVFTISFIRAMVRKESNRANAFTLAIYTGVDALLAFLLLGASFASWLAVLLFLVVVGVAFAYNVFIMSFALKLEQ
jgi:hypothetical protein